MTESVFIGIDYGNRKTGIAIGQTITETAAPLETVPTHPRTALWLTLEKLIEQWQPDGFIVGIPMTEQIKDHPLIPAILKFVKTLSRTYKKPVYLVDERLSSHEAAQQLKTQKKTRRKHKNIALDSMAAKIILETWLKNPHNHLNLESLEQSL